MSARTSRAYCAMLWPPSLDGDAPCPRKSSATTRWAAASASMLRSKKWRDMQTPCSSTSGRPEPTSVTATVAPVESPIRFSVIPVPSLTVTIAVQAHDEVLGAAREVAAEIAPRADLHDREGTFSQENIDALWRAGHRQPQPPRAHGGPGADLRTTAAAVAPSPRATPRRRSSGHAPHPPAAAGRRLLRRATRPPAPAVFASALARPGADQRAARRARARDAGPRRRPRHARAVADRRTAAGASAAARSSRTGASGLRWLVVWGATEDDPDGRASGGSSCPATRPASRSSRRWDHLGHARLGEPRRRVRRRRDPARPRLRPRARRARPTPGRDAAARRLDDVLLLAVYRGVAEAARDWLVGYLQRARAGEPRRAARDRCRASRRAVGEIEALLVRRERAARRLAGRRPRRRRRAAERAAPSARSARSSSPRNAIEAVEQAVALVGNAGLTRHHPLQRHLRDVLCSRIHTPQEDTSCSPPAAPRSTTTRRS